MAINAFWAAELERARELVEHAQGNDTAFVGVMRAKALLAMDQQQTDLEEYLEWLRWTVINDRQWLLQWMAEHPAMFLTRIASLLGDTNAPRKESCTEKYQATLTAVRRDLESYGRPEDDEGQSVDKLDDIIAYVTEALRS